MGKSFYRQSEEGQHVETAPSALTVILKLVSLRPFLGIRVAYVLTTAWSSDCKLPPGGDFSIYNTAQRTWLRILSITPEVLDFAHSIQFSSVTQSCPTPCNPMNHSTPGLPVHHQLLEFTQTHAHQVGDAIQPSHPLSSPSPPTPNPSQHQGLFQ